MTSLSFTKAQWLYQWVLALVHFLWARTQGDY